MNNEGKGKDHCDINPFITKNSLEINLTDFYIVLDNHVYVIDVFSVPITHLRDVVSILKEEVLSWSLMRFKWL